MFGFSYLVIKLNLNRDPGLSPALNLKSLIWFFTEIGGRIKVQKAKARVKLFTCIRRLHGQKVWNFAMQFLLLLPVLIDLLERGGVHKTCGMFATSYLQIKGLIMKQRCCKTKKHLIAANCPHLYFHEVQWAGTWYWDKKRGWKDGGTQHIVVSTWAAGQGQLWYLRAVISLQLLLLWYLPDLSVFTITFCAFHKNASVDTWTL